MKIVQTSLSESVTQHLAERILCGELPAGSVLPGENELATVSRGGWTPPSQNKSLAKDIVTVAQFTIFTLQRLSDADVQRWWVHHHRPGIPLMLVVHQTRRVSGVQPIFGTMEQIAAHWESYSPWFSRTIRTVRWRTSGEKRVFLAILFTSFSGNLVSKISGALHLVIN